MMAESRRPPGARSSNPAEKTEPMRRLDEYMTALVAERGASEHTIRAYRRELRSFAEFLIQRSGKSVRLARVEHPVIREYLATLYSAGLSKASVARALAAIRSWFAWLARMGHIEQNPARLVSTPKLPKHLPRVPGIEQVNQMLDGIDSAPARKANKPAEPPETAWPERDRAILELL
jgi:integrase/recombinase XerC